MTGTDGSSPRAPARYPRALLLIVGGTLLALAAAVWLAFFAAAPVAEDDPAAPTPAAGARDAAAAADRAVAAAALSPRQREAMDAIVRAYILEHPEVIEEAATILNDRQKAARIAPLRAAMERPFPGAVAGNPAGTVTVVEFTDYNCGFCRASVADVNALIASDPRVKIVFRELPILAPSSTEAARWALAAAAQGKYKAFHDAMFAGDKPSPASIQAAAVRAGLDLSAARAFVATAGVQAELDANLHFAREIGLAGTPAWIIGGQLKDGAIGLDGLREAIR